MIFAWFVLFAPAQAQDDNSLRIEARVAKGTTFVGQAIEVQVGVVSGKERPKIVPPRIDGADVSLIESSFRQLEANAIGDIVTETNLYLSRFLVIPTKPGLLVIPPFRGRDQDRSGASTPIQLTVQPIPAEGRLASYLRGVGRIEAKSEVTPSTLRLGQTFEYRLILNGRGAIGSTQWPLLSAFEAIKGLKIEQVGTIEVNDPPSRTFRYRLRPSAPGDLRLPSVTVATFDPALRRYVETRAPSLSVRIVDVPRFDPSSLDQDMPTIPELSSRRSTPIWLVGLAVVGLGATLLVYWRSRRNRPRRTALRLARAMRSQSDPTNRADRVASALTIYLATAIDRPAGELTPEEARQGIERAVADAALANLAGQLIERCARVRFGGDQDAEAKLSSDAADLFEALAKKRLR